MRRLDNVFRVSKQDRFNESVQDCFKPPFILLKELTL